MFHIPIGNRSHSPSYTIEQDRSPGSITQQGNSNKYEVHYHETKTVRPRLQIIKGPSHSGGPNGFLFSFTVKNVGEQSALNIGWGYEADDLDFHYAGQLTQNLSPQEEYRMNQYEYSQTALFRKHLKNPRIVFVFHDTDSVDLENRINIRQERRLGDENYNIKPTTG